MVHRTIHLIVLQLFNINVIFATKSAVCFLTREPPRETVRFCEKLAKEGLHYNLDVFIARDDVTNDKVSINVSSHVHFLEVPNGICLENGYQETMRLPHSSNYVTSWDRAVYYFCSANKSYDFVWLIEDDVFIPSTQAFLSFQELYQRDSDLVVSTSHINLIGDTSYWHWYTAPSKMIPPWSSSMMNVVGMSRNLMKAIENYVLWRGSVPFHEYSFNTLAIQQQLKIVTPVELRTILYRQDCTFERIYQHPNNMWHPVKNLTLQEEWRDA